MREGPLDGKVLPGRKVGVGHRSVPVAAYLPSRVDFEKKRWVEHWSGLHRLFLCDS